jgi:PhzF family phenazine biosynthesis protein
MGKDHESIPFYVVDAFTSEPFKGNPAAVCLLKHQREDAILQSIAAEFNLSETAFLLNLTKETIEEAKFFSLRWFTPKTEVPLCGHATLATAAVLFHEFDVSAKTVTFRTRSGDLTAQEERDSIILNFPSETTVPTNPNPDLLRTMGVIDFEDACLTQTSKELLIRLKSEEVLRGLEPDFEGMKSTSTSVKGVIVTSKGCPPYDFISRFFAPWLGINEDPVTGAAHTVLAPYWAKILGKREMSAYQASSRGGELKVRVHENRVDLVGKAIIVSKGELTPYGYGRNDYSK